MSLERILYGIHQLGGVRFLSRLPNERNNKPKREIDYENGT